MPCFPTRSRSSSQHISLQITQSHLYTAPDGRRNPQVSTAACERERTKVARSGKWRLDSGRARRPLSHSYSGISIISLPRCPFSSRSADIAQIIHGQPSALSASLCCHYPLPLHPPPRPLSPAAPVPVLRPPHRPPSDRKHLFQPAAGGGRGGRGRRRGRARPQPARQCPLLPSPCTVGCLLLDPHRVSNSRSRSASTANQYSSQTQDQAHTQQPHDDGSEKRKPGRPRGSRNRKPRAPANTPANPSKAPTNTQHPGFYSYPPAPGGQAAQNQQFYEFQWRALNLCSEFYNAAEELIVRRLLYLFPPNSRNLCFS